MNYYFNNGKLIKYNKEITITQTTYVKVNDVCLDETGYNFFMGLPHNKVEKEEKHLKVGKSKILLLNDKPVLTNDRYDNEIKTHSKYIREALKYIDKIGQKPICRGIFIDDVGTIIATDSRKAYMYDNGYGVKYIVIPEEVAKEIAKLNEEIVIKFNNYKVCACANNITIEGRLMIGEYPNIRKVFEGKNEIAFDRIALKQALEYGSMINETSKVLSCKNNQVKIYSIDLSGNTYEEEFNLPNLTVRFDDLKLVDLESKLYYESEKRPIIFSKDKEKIVLVCMSVNK